MLQRFENIQTCLILPFKCLLRQKTPFNILLSDMLSLQSFRCVFILGGAFSQTKRRSQSCCMPSWQSASSLLPIAPSSSSSSSSSSFSSSSSRRRRRRRFRADLEEFFHHSIIPVSREGGDRPVRIGLSNEAIPRDLDGRRPESRRWLSGPATSWWGPVRPERGRLVGGLTSTTVHFPRVLGTPAASC